MAQHDNRRRSRWGKRLRWLRRSYANAAEMIRLGRLSAPHHTHFDTIHAGRIYSLRRYHGVERDQGEGIQAPLLLVPPLMVTSEIYDMSPDVSAISFLLGQGIDVWLTDFGVPETVEGGMTRTLDDHVLAVVDALDRVRQATARDVHLGGYSQGGLFCYQAAAYRRGDGIASLVTFGSPVDIYRNLPMPEQMAQWVIDGLRAVIERPLNELEGLPGFLTSFGFKMLSPKKELQQVFEFVGKLHDRNALEKREARRRFLGGEGFVAWPGPALRTFVDEFIVANRMASGGFVIDGRTVSLADVAVPILVVVGLADDIARPAAVRAIRRAALHAEVHELAVASGHLGLVVGSKALSVTWPSVVGWLRWREGQGELPRVLAEPVRGPIEEIDDAAFDELDLDVVVDDFYHVATDALQQGLKRLARMGDDFSETVDALRWQLPRLTRLGRIRGDTRISLGLALAAKAASMPEATFFLWKGRAFSYGDADRRVDAVVRGLHHVGVRAKERVGVLMEGRPTYLSIVAALSRLGASAVLFTSDITQAGLERAIEMSALKHLVCDPDHAARGRNAWDGPTYALGGPYGEDRVIPAGVFDMETIDPAAVPMPADHEPNPGRAKDEAMVLLTVGQADAPQAARITNHRWAFSALGAAAGCTLDPSDTVYCVLPLHHAAGMLVAVGGAVVGGSRLALATHFAPDHFWSETRRYGATVVFYAGEMCRPLVDAPPDPGDDHNPVRLFAGSGMRRDVWERLRQRFKVGVLEFYASTESNAVLANASGEKIGSLGRPLPSATEMALVAYDVGAGRPSRDSQGRLRRCGVDQAGLLIARVEKDHPTASFDGSAAKVSTDERLLRDVFEVGDRWISSGDLLRQDADGDHWFVERVSDLVHTADGTVFTREIEDALYRRADLQMVAVHGLRGDDDADVLVATVVLRGAELNLARLVALVNEKLEPRQRPKYVCVVDAIPMTDGYRPLKRVLRERGLRGDVYALGDDGGYRRHAPASSDPLDRGPR